MRRLDRLEAALLTRARHVTLRPELACAVALLARGRSLADACHAANLHERRFRDVFTEAVGLAPKTFARVARLGRALDALVDPTPSLAAIAIDALRGPSDQFHGERGGTVRDPFGHEWMIGHEIEKVSPDEMQRRYDAMMKG